MYDPILQVIASILVPYIHLFGIFLVLYGHQSPGGGFAGGAIIAAGFLLMRLAFGSERASGVMPHHLCLRLESGGGLVFIFIGLLGLVVANRILANMDVTVLGMEVSALSGGFVLALGIAVAFKVTSTMFSLFQRLSGGSDDVECY